MGVFDRIRPGNCDWKVRYISSRGPLDCVVSVCPAPMDGLYAHDPRVCSTLSPSPIEHFQPKAKSMPVRKEDPRDRVVLRLLEGT